MNDEVLFIVRQIQGISPEYIENKPVSYRKNLVNKLLKEAEERNNGNGGMIQQPSKKKK